MSYSLRWFVVILVGLGFVSSALGEEAGIRFDRDIRPILSDNCFLCHGPNEEDRKAKLRLDREADAKKEVIVPGKPQESELYLRLTSEEPHRRMPPVKFAKKLTKPQIEAVRKWIEQGAKWTQHWAYLPPKRSTLPSVKNVGWARNSIDRFILARLQREKLGPSPEADRVTLIRRVTLDLTGLPPTPEEVRAFVADTSPGAYERVVERLLSSPAFGERMAAKWLDAARYGDTSVYHADGRRDMWAWRDQVVRAINRNQPFDRFTLEQLAGDLLPGATLEQKVASAFNRNNGTTDEGGLIEEEYRIEYAVDRVKTTSMVWLGLTMECSQCHDHKYDPISQKDYYRFFAYFNISADRGKQTRNGNSAPTVNVIDPNSRTMLPFIQGELLDIEQKIEARRTYATPEELSWLAGLEAKKKTPAMPKEPFFEFLLGEGKGKLVSDSVDAKRKGHIRGKVQWADARQDKGLTFDGSNFVDLGSLGDFERTDSFSYGGWVKPIGNPSGALLARMDDHGGHRGYDLLLSGGHLEVHIVNKWPDNAVKVRTEQKMPDNKWQHVFVTYDGSSKASGITIYVDGKPWKWKIERDSLSDSIRTKKPLHIGSRNPGGRLRGIVDGVRMYRRALTAAEVGALANYDPLAPILAIPDDKRTPAQRKQLRDYYLQNVDKAHRILLEERKKLKAREAKLLKPMTTVMIMSDAPKPRDTFILERGAYDAPTKVKVVPGTPSVLPPTTADAPGNRLGLAKWLVQPDHPLTARVAVNRYWQMLFGAGLVSTPADFGVQGAFPSHPKLLDWLAVEFRETGWDIKKLVRLIVTSATYRQSSKVTPELLERDPKNRLLARSPRFRLQGEFIRDSALAISGLLLRQMGGPGVKPYQPPGLWREVGLGGNPVFKQDHGDKLYRRSIYTYWKRSAPPPSLQIFDAPTREKCIVERPRTNTPLQALVTLNDVQFVEAARTFAQQTMLAAKSDDERIDYAFQRATGRKPRPTEVEVLRDVFAHSLAKYKSDEAAALQLLKVGESPRDESLNASEHAAWTVVGSLILNLDETLTRE